MSSREAHPECLLSVLRGPKPIWNHRQIIETNAGRIKDGIADRRRHGHDGCLASSCRRDVFAIHEDHFDFRNIAESRHAIACEMRIFYPAIFEFDGLEERAAQPLNHRADHLVAQTIRVNDGAAFERLYHARDTHRARSLIHCYFGKGRHVAASERCFIRKSSGSMFAARANASMCVSRAK